MNQGILDELNQSLLQNIKNMFSAGSSIEDILNVLAEVDPNDRLYRFYLEAACNQKLDGSIFLYKWNAQDQDARREILGYLEEHAKRIRGGIS